MPQRLDQPHAPNPHCDVLTRRLPATLLLAVSTLAILVATLFPSGETVARGWSLQIAHGEAALAETIQNLLLFIPLGMALALIGVRPLRAIALGAALSFSVEFMQQWIPGRDPSLGDIACNTASTAIGVGLVHFAPRWLFVPARRAAWHALAVAAAAAIVWLGTGAVLRPIAPPPPYHDVWTPNFNYWGHYRGKVLAASLGPLPLSQGLIDAADLRWPLSITAVAPQRPPSRTAPLVAILDARDTKVLILAVDHTDLALRWHMRAVDLTFEQPDLRWRQALARIAPGDTFTTQTWRGERGACLYLDSARRCGFGYTIGDGWKLIFYPEHFSSVTLGILNALWVGGWLLGVGYWGGRAGRNPLRYAAAAVSLVALLIVPRVTGLNVTPVTEWMGAFAGIAIGWLLQRREGAMLLHRRHVASPRHWEFPGDARR